MLGKSKRFKLNEIFHTAKGDIKFLRYIETPVEPLVEFINLKTGKVETDVYGIVYYKIIKYHKKLGIPTPKSIKFEYKIDFKRDLKFGVELELVVPRGINLEQKLRDAGVLVSNPNSTHEVVRGWKLVHDGSIRAPHNYRGYELVSPPSTDFKDLEIVCKVLKENKVKTNTSCGLHVHHDIHELKRQQIIRIYEFYNKYERLINCMHDKSRDYNKYCKPIRNIIDDVRSCNTKTELLTEIAGKDITRYYYSNCRYYKINLRSYLYYGTIEFRHAGASIKFDEIKDWIIFTHKIVERSLQIGNDVLPMDEDTLEKFKQNPINGFDIMMEELGIFELTTTSKNLRKRAKKGHERRIS